MGPTSVVYAASDSEADKLRKEFRDKRRTLYAMATPGYIFMLWPIFAAFLTAVRDDGSTSLQPGFVPLWVWIGAIWVTCVKRAPWWWALLGLFSVFARWPAIPEVRVGAEPQLGDAFRNR